MSDLEPGGKFQDRVSGALRDRRLRNALYGATAGNDKKRRKAWEEAEQIEALRDLASQIKDHTLDHLDTYLDQLVESLGRVGAKVHLASTREEANRIIAGIAVDRGCSLAAKGKSMTSEEIELNHALEAAGVEVVETDLGEYIVQLDGDRPSHITAPIVHKDVAAVAETFERELGVPRTHDPKVLVAAAREKLRDVYRKCDLGITGANFIVAESGTITIVMNEGNGRFCTSLPPVHIALIGIEKIVPTLADLGVFLKLLARSATGQRMTVDTMMITGPRRMETEEGPREVHVVLLDEGRSRILESPFRSALRCIRCGACLNICPVYRSIGGHAYGSVYPGPIGKIISPLFSEEPDDANLSRASSLCGACYEACPVKIDLPSLLVQMRKEKLGVGSTPSFRRKTLALRWAMKSLRSRWLYEWGQRRLRRGLLSRAKEGWICSAPGPFKAWTAARRDLKAPAKRSFRDWWREEGFREPEDGGLGGE